MTISLSKYARVASCKKGDKMITNKILEALKNLVFLNPKRAKKKKDSGNYDRRRYDRAHDEFLEMQAKAKHGVFK